MYHQPAAPAGPRTTPAPFRFPCRVDACLGVLLTELEQATVALLAVDIPAPDLAAIGALHLAFSRLTPRARASLSWNTLRPVLEQQFGDSDSFEYGVLLADGVEVVYVCLASAVVDSADQKAGAKAWLEWLIRAARYMM